MWSRRTHASIIVPLWIPVAFPSSRFDTAGAPADAAAPMLVPEGERTTKPTVVGGRPPQTRKRLTRTVRRV